VLCAFCSIVLYRALLDCKDNIFTLLLSSVYAHADLRRRISSTSEGKNRSQASVNFFEWEEKMLIVENGGWFFTLGVQKH
jgi:hypothetical protein